MYFLLFYQLECTYFKVSPNKSYYYYNGVCSKTFHITYPFYILTRELSVIFMLLLASQNSGSITPTMSGNYFVNIMSSKCTNLLVLLTASKHVVHHSDSIKFA